MDCGFISYINMSPLSGGGQSCKYQRCLLSLSVTDIYSTPALRQAIAHCVLLVCAVVALLGSSVKLLLLENS